MHEGLGATGSLKTLQSYGKVRHNDAKSFSTEFLAIVLQPRVIDADSQNQAHSYNQLMLRMIQTLSHLLVTMLVIIIVRQKLWVNEKVLSIID